MPLSPTTLLGQYRIESVLGSGGMGDVYRARDLRLNRAVAIKTLSPDVAAEKRRISRFELEARAAASLNHPNIVSVYDVGHQDGILFIVSELIDGMSLRAVLENGPLLPSRCLHIAAQIANGLATAHRAGITHRDIKPENIMVTSDWRVKILDFGLARQAVPVAPGSATAAVTQTEAGAVLGTPGYMAPEQVRGTAIDSRADIFALGAVLYEMISGRRAFAGDSSIEALNAIITVEPEELPAFVPAALSRIVQRCLAKSPDERFQNARDLAFALTEIHPEAGRVAKPAPRARRDIGIAMAIGLVCLAVGFTIRRFVDAGLSTTPVSRTTFKQITDQPGAELFPSLSPDGKTVVYAAKTAGNWDVWLQRVGGKNPTNLTADTLSDDTEPVFSPDGDRIAFRSGRGGGGIYVMGATGESVKRLTDFGYNPAWSPDGRHIAISNTSLMQSRPEIRSIINAHLWTVDVMTGERKQLSKAGDAVQPDWSPNGRRIAFWRTEPGGHRDVWTVAATGDDPVAVTNDHDLDWNPRWSRDGKHLYFCSDRGGSMNLWRVRIDEMSGSVLSVPEPLTTPSSYSAHVSVARGDARIAYVHWAVTANLQKIAFDPAAGKVIGQFTPITQGSRQALHPAISPNNDWLAFASGGRQEDILMIKSDGSGLRQLTDDIDKDRLPRWSPLGTEIAFHSNRGGAYQIWSIRPDGSGLRQLTFLPNRTVRTAVWSPDGARLAYVVQDRASFIMDVRKNWSDDQVEVAPLPGGGYFEVWSWSPDGRRLAGFVVGQDGSRLGVVLYTIATRAFQILTQFGAEPVWLADNRRLLFHHAGKLHLVDSMTGGVHEILSVAPHEIPFRGFSISHDNHMLYFTLETTETDVWLAQQ